MDDLLCLIMSYSVGWFGENLPERGTNQMDSECGRCCVAFFFGNGELPQTRSN